MQIDERLGQYDRAPLVIEESFESDSYVKLERYMRAHFYYLIEGPAKLDQLVSKSMFQSLLVSITIQPIHVTTT
jgi:hypothetical protein